MEKNLFCNQRWWVNKTVLPEVYKLQSNNPYNKYKAEICKDDGLLGIEFTLDKTISEFNRTPEKIELGLLHKLCRVYWKCKHFPEPDDPEVADPAQDCALAENFLRAIDLFLIFTLNEKKNRDCQYNYLAPGGDHGVHKELLTSPLNHLYCFEEMLCITKLLPEGDLPPPNTALQVEWFYMSFHCSDHAEYVRSGRKLSNEMLQTLAKYFESIFLARISYGSIQRK
jgi:hypothetical protein